MTQTSEANAHFFFFFLFFFFWINFTFAPPTMYSISLYFFKFQNRSTCSPNYIKPFNMFPSSISAMFFYDNDAIMPCCEYCTAEVLYWLLYSRNLKFTALRVAILAFILVLVTLIALISLELRLPLLYITVFPADEKERSPSNIKAGIVRRLRVT